MYNYSYIPATTYRAGASIHTRERTTIVNVRTAVTVCPPFNTEAAIAIHKVLNKKIDRHVHASPLAASAKSIANNSRSTYAARSSVSAWIGVTVIDVGATAAPSEAGCTGTAEPVHHVLEGRSKHDGLPSLWTAAIDHISCMRTWQAEMD